MLCWALQWSGRKMYEEDQKQYFLWHFSGFTRSRDFGNCRLLEQTDKPCWTLKLYVNFGAAISAMIFWIAKRGNGKWRSQERNVIKHQRKKKTNRAKLESAKQLFESWTRIGTDECQVPTSSTTITALFQSQHSMWAVLWSKVNERNQIT